MEGHSDGLSTRPAYVTVARRRGAAVNRQQKDTWELWKLTTELHKIGVQSCSSFRRENTKCFEQKTNRSVMSKEIIFVYFEIHKQQIICEAKI